MITVRPAASERALPDLVHDYGRMYGFVKPPIHGWTVRRLDRPGVVTDERAAELYPRLAGLDRVVVDLPRRDGDGLSEYHHGNDSGWDNATLFDMGFPVTAPDLAAYLVIQLDVLADACRSPRKRATEPQLARARGRHARAVCWSVSGTANGSGRSRIETAPGTRRAGASSRSCRMILGDRLPASVRPALVDGLPRERPAHRLRGRHGGVRTALAPRGGRLLAWPDLGADHAAHRRRPARLWRGRAGTRCGRALPRDVPPFGLRRELRGHHRPAPARSRLHLGREHVPASSPATT